MPTDPDAPGNEPNLELPSFGFGRRKKRGKKSGELPAEATGADAPEAPPEDVEAPEPGADDGLERTADATVEQAAVTPPPSPAPARPAAPRAPAAPPAPARAPVAGPTPARPAARPAARPPARPATTAAAPPPAVPEAEAPVIPVVDDGEPTLVDPLDQAAAALDAPAQPRARRRAEKAERKRSGGDSLVPRLPRINPLVAAIISGALSGLATVLLAFGAARGCDAVRGTESCGGGLGLLAVVAILAIEILIGANLLKAWRIADPFSTSFLGVGVVATIAMLAFLDHINSPWMLLVIPLMTAAAFALSWWVTVRVIEEHPVE